MMNEKKKAAYLPILLVIAVILGLFLGSKLNFISEPNKVFSIRFNKFDKFNEILNYIIEEYVDSISKDHLTEEALRTLLKNLDPHSAYIPAEELLQFGPSKAKLSMDYIKSLSDRPDGKLILVTAVTPTRYWYDSAIRVRDF